MPFDVKSRLAQARESECAKSAKVVEAVLPSQNPANETKEVFSTLAPLARVECPKSLSPTNAIILGIGINTQYNHIIAYTDEGNSDFEGGTRAKGAKRAKNSDPSSAGLDDGNSAPSELVEAVAASDLPSAGDPISFIPAPDGWVDIAGIRRPVLAAPPEIDFKQPRGVPGDWWAGLARLVAMPAPGGVPVDVWHGIQADACRVIRDAGEFLTLQDWTALEVFGVNQSQPLSQIPDCMGLIISLAGAALGSVRDNRKPGDKNPADRHQQAILIGDGCRAFGRFHPRPAACIPLWGLQ